MEAIIAVSSGLTIIPDAISMDALNAMDGNTRNSLLMGYAFTVIVQPFEIFRRLEERNYPLYPGDHCFKAIINDLNHQSATVLQIRFSFTHSQMYFVPYSLDVILKNVWDGQLHFYSKTTLPILMESLSAYGNGLKDHLITLVRQFPKLPPTDSMGLNSPQEVPLNDIPSRFRSPNGPPGKHSNQGQRQPFQQGRGHMGPPPPNVFYNQRHHFG